MVQMIFGKQSWPHYWFFFVDLTFFYEKRTDYGRFEPRNYSHLSSMCHQSGHSKEEIYSSRWLIQHFNQILFDDKECHIIIISPYFLPTRVNKYNKYNSTNITSTEERKWRNIRSYQQMDRNQWQISNNTLNSVKKREWSLVSSF